MANSFPPDPTMAVGPNSVLIATNDTVRIYNKKGQLVVSAGLAGFFCPVGNCLVQAGDQVFDPWVVYDPYINRFWVLAALANNNTQRSQLLLALSLTDDASLDWRFFSLDARLDGNTDRAQWCDYEKLGFDAQAIYLTCNMFDFGGGFRYAKVRIMTKTQLVNNTGTLWWDFWNLREAFLGANPSFTVQPAKMYGATVADGEYLINAWGFGGFCCIAGGALEVRRITNADRCCIAGNQSAPDIEQRTQGVGSFDAAPDAEQQGSTTAINTGDSRLLYAFWKNGLLATGHTIRCGSFITAKSCVAFTELNVSGFPNTISTVNDWVLQGTAPGATVDYYFPAVDVNSSGKKTMVYTRSGSQEFAGAVFIGIPSSSTCTNCVNGPETLLQAGQSSYVNIGCPTTPPNPDTRNRWGDYLGAAADPDGTGVWVHGEFAGTGTLLCNDGVTQLSRWGTHVGLTYESINVFPVPANDNAASAVFIGGSPFSDARSTVLATREANDPQPEPPCVSGDHRAKSVWYQFMALVSGTVTVDTFGSNYDTILSAWTGPPAFRTQVACNDDFVGLQSQISFTATAGILYSFMVSSFGTSGGSLVLNLVVPNPIPVINLLSPSSALAGGLGFTLVVNGSGFIPGSVIQWNGVNRPTTYLNSSQLSTPISAADILIPGTAVVTVVNPPPGGGTSTTHFFINSPPAPTNDNIASAIVMSPTPFADAVNVVSATTETTDPIPSCGNGSRAKSVWYRFTVVGSGLIRLTADTFGSNYDTILSAWAGSPGALTEAACNDNFGGLQSQIFMLVPPGTTLYFMVSSYSGTGGLLVFHFSDLSRVPVIYQPLAPSGAVPGGPGFVLTVNGTNFLPGSVVRWNGANRPTTFVNGTQLTATIPASDIQSRGSAWVTVFNPNPSGNGGATSNLAFFLIAPAAPGLGFVAFDYGTGQLPAAVVTADFNSDGKLDLAVVNSNDNTVSVFLGNGRGSFGSRADFATGLVPRGLTTGDFNLDGRLDLAVTFSGGSGGVSILPGNGDGTFGPKMDTTGVFPLGIAAGDFNGDGRLDLAVASWNSDYISILLGNGDGSFGLRLDRAGFGAPGAVVAGDFNRDVRLDLSVTNWLWGMVSVMQGVGDGTFGGNIDYTTGLQPNDVITADFNGDGKLDLAVVNANQFSVSGSISILQGNGDGTFGAKTDFPAGATPTAVTAGDFNGDGKVDLAVAVLNDNTVSILLGNGNGTFGAKNDFATGGAPNSLTTGDFDGDGRLDLAVANGATSTVSVLLNLPPNRPPVANAGPDQTVEASSPSGASVTLNGSASSDPDGDPLAFQWRDAANNIVGASAVVNLTLPLGTHTFTLMVDDGRGGTATDSVTINVQDTTPPVLTLPANITVEATGPAGAVAGYIASANDAVSGPIVPVCAPASGSTFPLGTTTVNCTATDGGGNTASGSFLVTVVDTTPPVLSLPASITALATSAAGAVVNFTGVANDLVDGALPVICQPPSGSTFAIGTTTVNCSASDLHGNSSNGSFSVTVNVGQPRLTARIAGKGTLLTGEKFVDIQFTNAGTGHARNVQITTLVLRTLSGTGQATVNSPPLPILVGSVNVGASVTVRILLNVPITVARLSITEGGTLADVMGTSFSFSLSQAFMP